MSPTAARIGGLVEIAQAVPFVLDGQAITQRLDARGERLRRHRLDDVVGGACAHEVDGHLHRVVGGQDRAGEPGVARAHFVEDLFARPIGKVDVDAEQIGRMGFEGSQAFGRRVRGADTEAERLQDGAQQRDHVLVVLDHEKVGFQARAAHPRTPK